MHGRIRTRFLVATLRPKTSRIQLHWGNLGHDLPLGVRHTYVLNAG